MSKEFIFKILIAGDASAGKTSLLIRYVDNKFDESTVMTIGVDFFIKIVKLNLDDGIGVEGNCIFQLWDLGGQERFRDLLQSYVMGARGALLLIDLTQPIKINNILQWVNIVRMHSLLLPIILVGTKFDLKELVVVSDEDVLHIKETFNMINYIKTSAKTGHNVNRVFNFLAKYLIKDK